MDRKEFLSKLGVGAAFALTASCLGGCTRDMSEPESEINIEVDLNETRFSNLETLGNFVIFDSIVLARTITGDYAAASQTCSHEALAQVTYDGQEEWYCTAHGARYTLEGEGLNAYGSKGLKVYQTELTGRTLRIFD